VCGREALKTLKTAEPQPGEPGEPLPKSRQPCTRGTCNAMYHLLHFVITLQSFRLHKLGLFSFAGFHTRSLEFTFEPDFLQQFNLQAHFV
jgi:hypothetical protein